MGHPVLYEAKFQSGIVITCYAANHYHVAIQVSHLLY